MWWDTRTALAVTWLFGLTLARRDVEMFMAPEDKDKFYVEEGGSISITCIAEVHKDVTVDLKWRGPFINPSEPQRLSNIPKGELEEVGNMLSVNDFNNKTAGKYTCKATPSQGSPVERTIELFKSCDVGKFNPLTCDESCSALCKLGPQGAQGRSCDHINGTCLYGCQEGHTGLKCTECDTDRFNPPSCNKTCSPYCKPGPDGAKGKNCDNINGICLNGCQEGYKMPSCTEKTEKSGDEEVIGGAIGGVLGLAFIAVLMILIVKYLRIRNVCYSVNAKANVEMVEAKKLTGESGNRHGKNMADDLDDQGCETNENEQGASGVSQTHAVNGDGKTKEDEQKDPLLGASGGSQTQTTSGNGNNEAMEQLKKKLEKEKEKRKSLATRVEELQKHVDYLIKKLGKEEQAKEKERQEKEKERQEKEKLKQELDKVTKERDELLAELKKTNKRCDELQEQMANLNKRLIEVEKTRCDKKDLDDLIRRFEDGSYQPAIDRKWNW